MASLTAGVFEFSPFSYECDQSVVSGSTFCGIEVIILKAVADALHLNLNLQTPSDGNKHWGTFYPNGTASGLFYDIINGVVDVGAGEFFNRVSRNRLMDPSEFYNYDYFCFMLKTPSPAPEWVQLVKPFQSVVWLWTFLSLRCTIGFLVVYSKLTGSLRNVALKGLSFFINQSTKNYARRGSAKILILFTSLCGFVLSLAYGGNLVSFLTVRSYPKPPQAMTEILDMPDMFWGSSGYTDKEDFARSTNPDIVRLAERFSLLNNWQEGFQRLQEGNFAFLNSLISSDYAIRSRFTNRYGISEMYIMNECWNNEQIVFYFPKGTKIKKPFEAVLGRLRESGLVSKWINDEMNKLARLQEAARLDTKETKLSLKHLQAPFFMALFFME